MNIKDLTSHSQIVEIIIESLNQPKIELDVNTFGILREGICYGCIATNFMCNIKDKFVTNEDLEYPDIRASFFEEDMYLIIDFTNAIDHLRFGILYNYDNDLKKCNLNIPELPDDIVEKFNNTFRIENENLHQAEELLTPLLNELKSRGL